MAGLFTERSRRDREEEEMVTTDLNEGQIGDGINVCFFGIDRSLPYTYRSILRNIIEPARTLRPVRLYGHFFDVRTINNPRSSEKNVRLSASTHLLPFDHLVFEKPDVFLEASFYEVAKGYGDAWGDNYASLRNLFHQLRSLDAVYRLSAISPARITIFARPDLLYHDNFKEWIERASRLEEGGIYIPAWQAYGGVNDRFCISVGDAASRAYAFRGTLVDQYCSLHGPLHAEKLLAFALGQSVVPVIDMPLRATRVRATGLRALERFDTSILGKIRAHVVHKVANLVTKLSR